MCRGEEKDSNKSAAGRGNFAGHKWISENLTRLLILLYVADSSEPTIFKNYTFIKLIFGANHSRV